MPGHEHPQLQIINRDLLRRSRKELTSEDWGWMFDHYFSYLRDSWNRMSFDNLSDYNMDRGDFSKIFADAGEQIILGMEKFEFVDPEKLSPRGLDLQGFFYKIDNRSDEKIYPDKKHVGKTGVKKLFCYSRNERMMMVEIHFVISGAIKYSVLKVVLKPVTWLELFNVYQENPLCLQDSLFLFLYHYISDRQKELDRLKFVEQAIYNELQLLSPNR